MPNLQPHQAYTINGDDLQGPAYRLNTILQSINGRLSAVESSPAFAGTNTTTVISGGGGGGSGGSASFWTQAGNLLYPSTTTSLVLLGGITADNGTGYPLQVNGSISLTGNNVMPFSARLWMDVNASQGQIGTLGGGPGTDNTILDNQGIECNFHRMKSHLDYFDWTNWGTSTAPLAAHTLQLRDSSNQVILNYSGTGAAATGTPGPASGILVSFGHVFIGLASTDLSLSSPSLLAKNVIGSVTATTNASTMTITAVAGTYSALSAGRSGAGTYLPMTFFTNNAEAMRIDTSQRLLVGGTADNVSGGTLQVTGSIGVSGVLIGTQLAVTSDINASNAGSRFSVTISAGTSVNLISAKQNAGGTFLPMTFVVNNAEQARWLTTGKYLIARTTDDGSAARLQIGTINDATGSINAGGLIQSYVTGTNVGLQVNSGTFVVNGAGAVSAAGPLNIAGASLFGAAGSPDTGSTVHVAGPLLLGGSFFTPGIVYSASNDNLLIASGSTGGAVLQFGSWTGTNPPQSHFTEMFRAIPATGVLLFGLTSTDLSLSAGAIVSANSIVSATASANATVGSFAAVAGNYVAISSTRTGAGTFQPMTFFTNAAERMRILTGGQVLINRTTDDATGAQLQVQGSYSSSGVGGVSKTQTPVTSITVTGGIVTAVS